IETGDSCPVNQYYYSGFVALQTLLDYTKIRIVTQNEELQIPHITLEMFPKEAYTGNWMVAFRLVIPIYMVMALSQFITYLLILIVGEKENHIKEGLKIMGLRDSVFWCGWFIIYAVFVTFLSFVSVILVFSLGVFQHTNYLPVFILILLYSFSVILIGFMITPFFDNSRTAGILGNFAVNIMSLLYFLQVFIDDTHTSAALWTVSLISPTGFALAMDKILVLDISGQGVTLHNLWTGPGIPIGGSILMLVVDILLYAALAFYFDCVIPSDHGTKQRPCFCFNRNYWCKKKVPKVPLLNGESANSFNNALEDQARDVEPVSREMRGKEAIRIVDLYKTFHSCRKPAVNAVNGINLTIYEGQITAILGHNGAGKSTLFNILTGLTSPTSGTIYIFGYDVRDPNDMTMIRRMTGVCPQHDILFETLTPKEHLYFFAAVRGIPPSLVDSEVKKTLRDIDLFDTAETRVKHLSGGQKRKLSVGIAIIGDPKIIILDEPTAGVDPYSRRHMWSILQNRKHGKVILLTTHFMDEADILAERKAVVSRGRLRCCGSSLFLKNKFGIGYHLTLVLDTNACETSITKLVNDHVPQAEKARRHGRELSYILPHDAVNSFVSLFDDIEKEIKTKRMMLGICSYGVSMTTLEEVFLHLETQREGEQKAGATGEGEDEEGEGEEDEEDGQAAGYPVWSTIGALLKLRLTILFRDIQRLYLLIILPLAFTALGLYLNSIQVLSPIMRSILLDNTTYGSNITKIAIHDNTNPAVWSHAAYLYHHHHQPKQQKRESQKQYDPIPQFLHQKHHQQQQQSKEAAHLYHDAADGETLDDIAFQPLPSSTSFSTTSSTSGSAAPDRSSSDSILRIELWSHPFQQTAQPQEFNIGTFSSALFVGMIFVLIPVSLAVDMVYDREMKAKNQLRVNGLSSSLYLSAYFIVLSGLMLVICAALLGLVFIFDIPSFRQVSYGGFVIAYAFGGKWCSISASLFFFQPPALITLGMLVFLYSPAGILCSTCFSYFFDRTDSAQSILPNILTFVGLIPYWLCSWICWVLVSSICRNKCKTVTISDFLLFNMLFHYSEVKAAIALHYVFSLINPMYIPYATVYFVDRVYIACRLSSACAELSMAHYMTEEVIVMACGCLLHIPIWAFCLRVSDVMKSGGRMRDLFHRSAVSFRTDVSVRSLSIGVDAGEVLGLLGHNGAGKTTTMKIMTGETAPTRGTVRVAGHSITINQDDAFKTLGYCPQHDALWKNVTVREHLELYARIRGVRGKDLNRLISTYLTGLHINEHANKQTQHCSGGTRRKLSYAMAMVGAPKVVLLDEPSTGMDPKSKRFLWDTILASFHGKRCAMLTTHSMEEADALCSRVGIMVKGELRCLGSTQHLKNLYGAGYTLEIKLKHIENVYSETPIESQPSSSQEQLQLDQSTDHIAPVISNCIDNRSMALRNFVTDLFPSATLEESFADRLVYSVPQQAVSSLAECFSRLEKAKTELDIEEYSFSQTTLEQVFLKFA
ncbi:AGAP010416-PA, partial [Anopheles gambiae str. PEST]